MTRATNIFPATAFDRTSGLADTRAHIGMGATRTDLRRNTRQTALAARSALH
jgi:hypothetical protein